MADIHARSDGTLGADVRAAIRDIPDFPKPGIVFKDITPLLGDPMLLRRTVAAMASPFAREAVSHVVGVESRGFILGAPVALELAAGFIPVRKPGKLPYRTDAGEYALEYRNDRLEINAHAYGAPARELAVEYMLVTGGT